MKPVRIACDTKDHLPIESLTPIQGDLKSLSEGDYTKLRQEILDTGFAFPIYVWRSPEGVNYIVAGHQRHRTLTKMKADGHEVPAIPVVYIEADSMKQAKRRVLQDVSQYGQVEGSGLHEFMIGAEMDFPELEESFRFPEIDLDSFKMEFIDDNTVPAGEDEVGEPPVEPKSKRGDLWILGRHRILCGDSTQITDVERLMGREKADLWITDPPYGVDIKKVSFERYEQTGRGNTQSSKEEIHNDIASKEGWKEVIGSAFNNAFIACSDKASHYVFTCQGSDKQIMMMMMQEAGWNFRHELIWKKDRFILGRSDYHYQHEPILYGWKTEGTHEFYGGRDKSSIIETPVYKNDLHPTMKPVELLEQLISNSSQRDGVVFDTFLGSGSTLIACEKVYRRCFGIELSPQYIDVILARWTKLTSKDPVRDDGVTWSSLQ